MEIIVVAIIASLMLFGFGYTIGYLSYMSEDIRKEIDYGTAFSSNSKKQR